MKLQGDEHCCDCMVKLEETTARARARVVDMGTPETTWEASARFGEMPIAEQMERAGVVELVCATCYAKQPGLESQ